MKTEKLSLKSIKNVLSRAEMKKIMAGSGSGDLCPGYYCDASGGCPTGCGCQAFDGNPAYGYWCVKS